MRITYLVFVFLFSTIPAFAQANKPVLFVQKDGFPSGHTSPEGIACDFARALIRHDIALFKETCLRPYINKQYDAYLQYAPQRMREDAQQKQQSPFAPQSIRKVFAVRSLTKPGPATLGYNAFGYKAVQFVDVIVMLRNGKPSRNRTLVILDADGKWYVHPIPSADTLLSTGLDSESISTKDFKQAYTIHSATP